MSKISIKRFSFACGVTGTLIYVGHILLVLTVGSEITVSFLYNVLFGLNVSTISNLNTLIWEISVGMIATFVQAGFTGGCIAMIYNISLRKSSKAQ